MPRNSMKILLFVGLVAASAGLYQGASYPLDLALRVAALMLCILVCYTLQVRALIRQKDASLDGYFDMLKAELRFMVQLYPSGFRDRNVAAELRSISGPLSERLRNLLRMAEIKPMLGGIVLLSLFMYLYPGLPDFLGPLDNIVTQIVVRYIAVCVLVSNLSLVLCSYSSKQEL